MADTLMFRDPADNTFKPVTELRVRGMAGAPPNEWVPQIPDITTLSWVATRQPGAEVPASANLRWGVETVDGKPAFAIRHDGWTTAGQGPGKLTLEASVPPFDRGPFVNGAMRTRQVLTGAKVNGFVSFPMGTVALCKGDLAPGVFGAIPYYYPRFTLGTTDAPVWKWVIGWDGAVIDKANVATPPTLKLVIDIDFGMSNTAGGFVVPPLLLAYTDFEYYGLTNGEAPPDLPVL